MTKDDFKIGQTVFLKIEVQSNAARLITDKNNIDSWIKSAVVKTIGHKYITVICGPEEIKFDIHHNFNQVYDFGGIDYRLYPTKEDAIDATEKRMLYARIMNAMDWIHYNDLSIEQIRKIADVLNIKLEKTGDFTNDDNNG